jgi:hypothetical protein
MYLNNERIETPQDSRIASFMVFVVPVPVWQTNLVLLLRRIYLSIYSSKYIKERNMKCRQLLGISMRIISDRNKTTCVFVHWICFVCSVWSVSAKPTRCVIQRIEMWRHVNARWVQRALCRRIMSRAVSRVALQCIIIADVVQSSSNQNAGGGSFLWRWWVTWQTCQKEQRKYGRCCHLVFAMVPLIADITLNASASGLTLIPSMHLGRGQPDTQSPLAPPTYATHAVRARRAQCVCATHTARART